MDCRWVLYGFLGGSMCENFDMRPLLAKRISLIATTLKSRSDAYKADLIAKLDKILFPENAANDGYERNCWTNFRARPVIERTFALS